MAYKMLDQANKLHQVNHSFVHFTYSKAVWQPMGLFVMLADAMYGSITTLQHDNWLVKHIPWSAFKMSDRDWTWVIDVCDILGVSSFNFMSATMSNIFPSIRILIEFNSTFPLKSNQHSGMHFPLLKSYKPHRKRSVIHRGMPCTRTPSTTVLQRSGNIIPI